MGRGRFRERDGKSSVFLCTCKSLLKNFFNPSCQPYSPFLLRGASKNVFPKSGRKGKGLLHKSKHRGEKNFLPSPYGVLNATGNTLPL